MKLRTGPIVTVLTIVVSLGIFPELTGYVEADEARLAAEIDSRATRFMSLLYSGKFDEATRQAQQIIRRHGEHPAGYFFHALSLEVQMVTFGNCAYEDDFYRLCEKTIEKAENMLETSPGSPWPNFFIGGANGLMGMYEMELERWITAFRHAWKGMRYLRKVQERFPGIHDVYFGIGSYEYWRSAKAKQLWWAPSDEDKRSQGIQKLYKAKNKGLYTKEPSADALIDIFNREARYTPAMNVVNEYAARYPNSLVFLWGKVHALIGTGSYAQAEALLKKILRLVENGYPSDTYNRGLVYYHLARVYISQDNYDTGRDMAKRCLQLSYSGDQREMLKEVLTKAQELTQKAAP
jgi:hypothetical protein